MTVEFMPTGRDIIDANGDVRHISDLTPAMLEDQAVDVAEDRRQNTIRGSVLSVGQAADVLTWLHAGLNVHEREHGYRDSVNLGRAAWLASSRNPRDFVVGMNMPLLTPKEAVAALDAVEQR